MNKREVLLQFKGQLLPYIIARREADGMKDWPARREAWNNYIDSLEKDGHITEKQADTWDQPTCVKGDL